MQLRLLTVLLNRVWRQAPVLAYVTAPSGVRSILEHLGLPTRIGSLIQGTNDLQQLTVGYPTSPLNEDHLGGLRELLHRHAPHPGERAPDADVIAADGSSTTLFAHLYNPDGWSWGWSLLAFDGRRSDAMSQLRIALAEVQGWKWVRPRLVLGAAIPEADDATVLSDLDGVAHAAYGLGSTPALILVRPDGHIAFRGPADEPERLRAYCNKVFGPAPGQKKKPTPACGNAVQRSCLNTVRATERDTPLL